MTIALTVEPISHGVGPTEKSPTYNIQKLFEKGNEAFIVYDCKTKNGGGSRNTEILHYRRKQDKRNRSLLWLCPEGTSVKNDPRNLC
jgi:hypothetical protein